MKYKETGFRAFYKKFTVFMFTDTLREVTKNFPGAEQGNCILTYGYIDRFAGLTLEILAVGVAEKDNVTFFDGTDTYRSYYNKFGQENRAASSAFPPSRA